MNTFFGARASRPRHLNAGSTPAHRLGFALAAMFAMSVGITAIAEDTTAQSEPMATKRWMLLCCGLPGDDGHRTRLTEACKKIINAAEPVLGVEPSRLQILAGDETMQAALVDDTRQVGVCSQDSVAAAIRLLSDTVKPDDDCWILLLGHAHLYDGNSQFNVQGPDFDQRQFAEWSKSLVARHQVFLLTMPVSGFWIKPLARESRVIIAATEADQEYTGTEMPYALADFLSEGVSDKIEDVDGDGVLSLLDMYLAVNLDIQDRFESMERLQTEHAQLDDNGDGRGTEVQQPYLPVKTEANVESKPERPNPIEAETLDGFRSRQILLNGTES